MRIKLHCPYFPDEDTTPKRQPRWSAVKKLPDDKIFVILDSNKVFFEIRNFIFDSMQNFFAADHYGCLFGVVSIVKRSTSYVTEIVRFRGSLSEMYKRSGGFKLH